MERLDQLIDQVNETTPPIRNLGIKMTGSNHEHTTLTLLFELQNIRRDLHEENDKATGELKIELANAKEQVKKAERLVKRLRRDLDEFDCPEFTGEEDSDGDK
jgi:hypothetical protein